MAFIDKERYDRQLNLVSYIDSDDGTTPSPSCTQSISTVHYAGVMASLWERTIIMRTCHYGGEIGSLSERTVTMNRALPQDVRHSNSLPSFTNKLKTFLFSEHFI